MAGFDYRRERDLGNWDWVIRDGGLRFHGWVCLRFFSFLPLSLFFFFFLRGNNDQLIVY